MEKKKKSKNIKQLLMTTYTERHRWIVEEGPSVQDVVRQYPPLRIQRWVRHEFTLASAVDVANVLEDWKVVWEPKVIRMRENEKEASKALKDKLEEHPQQCLSGQCLTILEHMFYPRNTRGKNSVLCYIDEECVNVEEKIMEIAQEEAYIICNSNQFHVVVDGSYMYSIDTLADALLDLLCIILF